MQGLQGEGSATMVVTGGPWEVCNCRILSVHGTALVTAEAAHVLIVARCKHLEHLLFTEPAFSYLYLEASHAFV